MSRRRTLTLVAAMTVALGGCAWNFQVRDCLKGVEIRKDKGQADEVFEHSKAGTRVGPESKDKEAVEDKVPAEKLDPPQPIITLEVAAVVVTLVAVIVVCLAGWWRIRHGREKAR